MRKRLYHKVVATLVDLAYDEIPFRASHFPRLEQHPLAAAGRQIMHPFLGELGLEVRGFLGQVEPWLRSGWVIPARRSCLYPELSAFEDPVFFERIDAIKKRFSLREMVGRLDHGDRHLTLNVASGLKGSEYEFSMGLDLETMLGPMVTAQMEVRRAFLDRYGHDQLLPTQWHRQLSSQMQARDDLYYAARHAIIPSYLPPLIVRPPFDFYPHIGIQLRNVAANPSRNSDPARMGRLAALASQLLNLPVLVYGKPTDQTLPDYPSTRQYMPDGTPQLHAELVFLKQCRLMISPDSGWADLMGWLRIPTLLERLAYPAGFEALRPFRPKMLVADDRTDIAATITRLCTADADTVLLPDPTEGEFQNHDFLTATGEDSRTFWQDFYGQMIT
ncbi:hypothetical protein [Nitrospirillum iridis]|uniref:Uncharacterized protein n=1 Tax=Nitrospirillum iridis TaxID=765888 RepID=A0A7X0AZK9_9PROT|nr:hypothetical protein [Nitrospirillum iridis]MBB6252950.1 hypothetical protein [Nitrospirillum iridis]